MSPIRHAALLHLARLVHDELLSDHDANVAEGPRRPCRCLPPNGRPRIVYLVTQRGRDLLELLERVVKEYRDSFRSNYDRELEALEGRLASGERAEEMYFKKRKELEARYASIL